MTSPASLTPQRRNRYNPDNDPTRPANWRLPASLLDRLKAESDRRGRSQAWVICDLLSTLPPATPSPAVENAPEALL